MAYVLTMSIVNPLTIPVAVVTLMAVAEPALADCNDVAAPGVYWRRCVQDGQNLQNADLSGATLRDSSFKRADLSGANLAGVDARRAKFVSSVLAGANFDGARLVLSDLTKAELRDASLKDADLTRAKMFRADLRGADLTGARIDGIDLLKAELGGAIWIDGKTVCAEDSIGQCHPTTTRPKVGEEVGASG
jgi:uncharacterized protein YjbI with pentapeptide repeats